MNKRAVLFSTLFVIMLSLCFHLTPALSVSATIMTFERASYLAAAGTTFNVTVVLKDLSSQMVTWQLALSFDSNIIEYRNVSLPRDNIFAGKDIVIGGPAFDNPGYVILGASLLRNETTGARPSVNGSGKLCTFGFSARSAGNTNLTLANQSSDTFLIGNVNENDIPFTILNGSVRVDTFLGDVNSDKVIDMKDVATGVLSFNSMPGSSRWNSNADLDNSGRVDMRDLTIIAHNFNQHE